MDFVIILLAALVIGLMTIIISAQMGIARDRRRAQEQEIVIQNVAAQAVDRTIEKHVNTLVKKAKQTIYLDDYGNTITQDWDKAFSPRSGSSLGWAVTVAARAG